MRSSDDPDVTQTEMSAKRPGFGSPLGGCRVQLARATRLRGSLGCREEGRAEERHSIAAPCVVDVELVGQAGRRHVQGGLHGSC